MGLTWCRSISSYTAAVLLLFSGMGRNYPVSVVEVLNLLLLMHIPEKRPATYVSAPTKSDTTTDTAIGTEREHELSLRDTA